MYSNKYLKAYLMIHNIKQSDIALLLNKSISTIHRKNEDLGYTQKEIILLNQKMHIPFKVFFYDFSADDSEFLPDL
ncbi:hypothetical protein [Companilactobacillus sp. HBUAS59699]|uniref:hypothetical protein n=1 Tax=Companilactobacillus sp. HBUAS59699 TaxID=3109358 RepID=UPI002FF02AA0